MTSARLMESSGVVMPGMPMPGSTGVVGAHAPTSSGVNLMMVRRCMMTFSKCPGGMKVTCACEDKVSTAMLQNLCSMMAVGLLSCCCVMNGMMVCCYNMMMTHCECEPTEDGVCMTCTSGDPNCTDMIETCCASMTSMIKAGCSCCIMMNNMPICCG